MNMDKESDLIPVIFRIKFMGSKGLFEMSRGYSAYHNEDEVLIQDGLEYTVESIEKIYNDNKCQLVTLKYPADEF